MQNSFKLADVIHAPRHSALRYPYIKVYRVRERAAECRDLKVVWAIDLRSWRMFLGFHLNGFTKFRRL